MDRPLNRNTNFDYVVKGIYSIIIAALIIKIFFSNLWGTGVLSFGLMGLIIVIFVLITRRDLQESLKEILKHMLKNGMPLIVLTGIILWLFSLFLMFNKKIEKDHVPESFHTFSNISTVLVILQLILVYKFLMDQITTTKSALGGSDVMEIVYRLLSSQIISLLYLLTLFNFIVTGFIQVILKYFTTDG